MASVLLDRADTCVAPEQGQYDAIADKVQCDLLFLRNSGVTSYDKKTLQETGIGDGSEVFYGLKFEGRYMELDCFGTGGYVPQRRDDGSVRLRCDRPGGGRRGVVKEFSWASRRRLLKLIARLAWQMLGQVWFVTLTYPPHHPFSGPQYKAHLQALRKRIESKYGEVVCVWKMEFQWKNRPGVPHFHLMLRLPGAGLEGGPSVLVFRQEVGLWWSEIIAPGDEEVRRARTQVQIARSDGARYMAYALSEKERQNQVPRWIGRAGRFWGVWRADRLERGVRLTQAEWIELRRTMRKWNASKGRKPSKSGAFRAEFSLVDYLPLSPGRSAIDVLAGATGLLRILEREVLPVA